MQLWRHARYVLTENPVTLGAFVLLLGFVVLAVLGPTLAPHDPLASNSARTLEAPSRAHWFGTDQVGRDILSRVMVATRLDFAISLSAVALSFALGSLAGSCAGFFGGWTERLVSRVVDTIMAFPLFVLAMAIVAALGNTVANVVYATAIINFPFYARMARAEANVRREAGYVEAARLAGNRPGRVLAFHIFPNCLPPMMVQLSLNMGWAILNAAGLSFIGLGVRVPRAEWGVMISMGLQDFLNGHWWIYTFPGVAIAFTVLGFNLLGDGLQDILDPRRRRS